MKGSLALTAAAILLLVVACTKTTPDTTNPTIVFVEPGDQDTLDAGNVLIRVNATDNEAVTKVEFSVDGTLMGADSNGVSDTFSYSWDASAETPGSAHTLGAKALDSTGNFATATISVVMADTTTPPPVPTEHTSDITGGDSTWYPADNPHVVKSYLNIRDNGKLTIMPGCTLMFDTDAGFVIGSDGTPGEIQAVGTADSVIVLTSGATTPAPGDWKGFDFYEGTRAMSHFRWCEISYGGLENYGAVNLDWSGSVRMDSTKIMSAPKYGIWLGAAGSYLAGFMGNTVTACGDYPLYVYPEKLSMLEGDNTLTGNGTPAGSMDAIYVAGGYVQETGTWLNQGVPYILGGGLDIGSTAGAYLSIESGTTVELGVDRDITVGGSNPGGLDANGVTFTSSVTTPQNGDWYGIWFYDNSNDDECQLSGCLVEFGGGDGYGNIWIEDARPTITGCEVRHSAAWGIYLSGTLFPDPIDLEFNNTFFDNDSGNIRTP